MCRDLTAHGRDRFPAVGLWDVWGAGGTAGQITGLDQVGWLRGWQRRQDRGRAENGPRWIYANGGDTAVARRVQAVGTASRRTVTAPPLWQTQAVFTGLIGGLHL